MPTQRAFLQYTQHMRINDTQPRSQPQPPTPSPRLFFFGGGGGAGIDDSNCEHVTLRMFLQSSALYTMAAAASRSWKGRSQQPQTR